MLPRSIQHVKEIKKNKSQDGKEAQLSLVLQLHIVMESAQLCKIVSE